MKRLISPLGTNGALCLHDGHFIPHDPLSRQSRQRALDRTQHARWFKIAATIALALVVVGAYVWYAIGVQNGTFAGSSTVLERLQETSGLAEDDPRLRLIGGVLEDSSVTVSAGVGAAATGRVHSARNGCALRRVRKCHRTLSWVHGAGRKLLKAHLACA